jgi:hypothetical protein
MTSRTMAATAVATVLVLAGAVLTRTGNHETPDPAPTEATPPPVLDETPAPPPAGPVASAVAAVSASQDWLYLTDDQIRAAVVDISTGAAGPALAEQTVSEIATARADLELSRGPVWWIVHPLATHLVEGELTAAQVEVWAVTVLSAVDIAAPQAEWMTFTVDLAFEDDEWRVEGLRDRPGPSPALGPHDQPWDAAPFAVGLDGFERLDGTVAAKVPR